MSQLFIFLRRINEDGPTSRNDNSGDIRFEYTAALTYKSSSADTSDSAFIHSCSHAAVQAFHPVKNGHAGAGINTSCVKSLLSACPSHALLAPAGARKAQHTGTSGMATLKINDSMFAMRKRSHAFGLERSRFSVCV